MSSLQHQSTFCQVPQIQLPEDVLREILARLPVKSLMQFKCVCRFFYDLIERDDGFKQKHYEMSRSRGDFVIFTREILPEYKDPGDRPELIYSRVSKEPNLGEIVCVDQHLPIQDVFGVSRSDPHVTYIRCADGLLCLCAGEFNRYGYIMHTLIWNPSTRDVKVLPYIDISQRVRNTNIAFELCNESSAKVVVLWDECPRDSRAMVCSEVKNSWGWRQVNHPGVCLYDEADFFFKGKYYWITRESNFDINYLVWFDMDEEVFGTIALPPSPPLLGETGTVYMWSKVSAINNTIALISYTTVEHLTDIWLMSEDNGNITYYKHVSLDVPKGMIPVTIWNSGCHLLVCDDVEVNDFPHLISIDLVTKERTIVKSINSIRTWDMYMCPVVCCESLKFV